MSVQPMDVSIEDIASALASAHVMPCDSPTASPILHLHGEHPGEVLFMRDKAKGTKTPREMENLGSVRVSDLAEVFPEYLAPFVEDDAFQTVNGLGHWEGAKPAPLTNTPKVRHRRRLAQNIDWLTSCWVDLDFGRDGSTFSAWWALGAFERHLVFPGHVPSPSMFLMSGRGLWLFWLLRGDDGRSAIKATANRLALHKRINREIAARISDYAPELMPDGNATDAARVCRVPGSRNSSAGGARVAFGVMSDETHTPEGLAARLGLASSIVSEIEAKPERARRGLTNITGEQAARGRITASENRLNRLAGVFTRWGNIPKGKRNEAAFVYACALRWRHGNEETGEAFARLRLMNDAWCDPPLPASELRKTFDSAWSGTYRHRDGEIVHRLGISDDDARTVGFPTREETRVSETAATRRQKAEQRRELILALVRRKAGEVPTIDTARDWLNEHGIEASHRTVWQDYRRLGIQNPRGREAAEAPDMFAVMETAGNRHA